VVFWAPTQSRVSQWHEEHEFLITVVAWAKTERPLTTDLGKCRSAQRSHVLT
jgi:hypothetical protein